MEKAGVVSIWVGTGHDRGAFSRMLEYRIEDDDFFDPGRFCQAAGISSYDPDIFGGRYYPKPITRPSLLFKDAPDVADRISTLTPDMPPSNCYVLLYEYAYEGPKSFRVDGFEFTFLGCLDVPPYDPQND